MPLSFYATALEEMGKLDPRGEGGSQWLNDTPICTPTAEPVVEKGKGNTWKRVSLVLAIVFWPITLALPILFGVCYLCYKDTAGGTGPPACFAGCGECCESMNECCHSCDDCNCDDD